MKNKHLMQATQNAIAGLRVLFAEKAARRELALLVGTALLLLIQVNVYTLLIFALSWALLAVEAMNTAIEKLCDLYSTEYDLRIKSIKDVAAAAIFLILLGQASLLLLWLISWRLF
jgi:diacylglycerol kinase (ATP)